MKIYINIAAFLYLLFSCTRVETASKDVLQQLVARLGHSAPLSYNVFDDLFDNNKFDKQLQQEYLPLLQEMSNRVKKAREVKIYSYAEAQQRGESLLKFSDVNDSKGVGVCIL